MTFRTPTFLVLIAVFYAGLCWASPAPPTVKRGELVQNETWSGEVLIAENVLVPKGMTLTILPGTTVKFKHWRFGYESPGGKLSLVVKGTLKAIGTPLKQIWFTSDAAEPMNGDWEGVRFEYASPDSILKYTVAEFGVINYHIWSSSPTISHAISRWANAEGIYMQHHARPLIERSRIYMNGYNGIAMETINAPTIRNNHIFGNSGGIVVDYSTPVIEGNLIEKNEEVGIVVLGGALPTITGNTIRSNKKFGVMFEEGTKGAKLSANRIHGNETAIGGVRENVEVVPPLPDSKDLEPKFDYPDSRRYELGYKPGDPQKDRYPYVLPPKDATREVVAKYLPGDTFGGLAYGGGYIWAALDKVLKIDPSNGKVVGEVRVPFISWLIGIAHDGKNLWLNGYDKPFIFEYNVKDQKVVSKIDISDIQNGAKGFITWAEGHLYLVVPNPSGVMMYKFDRKGKRLEVKKIEVDANMGLTWDGKYFWTSAGNLYRFDYKTGKVVGRVNRVTESTRGIAWDGKHMWVGVWTNETWRDEKLYKIKILGNPL